MQVCFLMRRSDGSVHTALGSDGVFRPDGRFGPRRVAALAADLVRRNPRHVGYVFCNARWNETAQRVILKGN